MENFDKYNEPYSENMKEDIHQESCDDMIEQEEKKENAETDATENKETYSWYDDDFEPAMSGTVTERALSLYRPKPKKNRFKSPIFVAVISSVVTSCLCLCLFAASFGIMKNMSSVQKPEGNVLSLANSSSDETVKNTVNTTTNGVMSIPDIYDKVSPAVVNIISTTQTSNTYLQDSTAMGSGSGVILTADGYIVTNNHVVDGASIITVKTTANQTLDAQVVGKDVRTDLAVLKVSCDQALPFAELGDSAALRVGDMALAIGNPLQEALASTLTVGYISAINRTMVIQDRQMTMLQTDAAINPGNSGGALINIYGQVIGINTAKSTGYDVEGLGFAIPINEAIPVIESIIENGYVKGRPLVGLNGIDVTEQISKANDIPVGVYVQKVIDGGAADKGGIKAGDVIVKFDGKDVKSIDEVNELRDKHKVGDKVDVVLSRNGQKVTVTIELQEEKPAKEEKVQQENPYGQMPNQNGGGNGQQYPFPSDFFSWFGW